VGFLKKYLETCKDVDKHLKSIACLASLDNLVQSYPTVGNAIVKELLQQRTFLKLIASENYSSLDVQLSMGNLLTDKYAEGFPHHRFYAGCGNIDVIEEHAVNTAKKLFNAEHAYVQPHSGADANLVAYWSILIKHVESKEIEKLSKKSVNDLTPEEYEQIRSLFAKQKMLGLSLEAGGHLTHGSRVNLSSKMLHAFSYGVDPKTGLLDYKEIERLAMEIRPLILLGGYSAYPRLIDFAKLREIANKVGAVLVVDMAHFSGLVAGKALTGNFNPIPFADVVTSTTHKTLRGPRGGIILCKKEYQEFIDKGCPIALGGPLPHVMAAKAIAFEEALSPDFETYASQIILNAKALAEAFLSLGCRLITNGTDNHLVLIDVNSTYGLTGRQAETALSSASITLNRNSIPHDPNGPWYTSGIRLGSPALTTRGLKEKEMRKIAECIHRLLKATSSCEQSKSKIVVDENILTRVQRDVSELLEQFPLYPEIII
jgi:glycine hydroxymethyltransferase